MRAYIRWEDPRRYDIGTIVQIGSDHAGIYVRLMGTDDSIGFLHEQSRIPNPHIYLLS
jgi:hypothetical protein